MNSKFVNLITRSWNTPILFLQDKVAKENFQFIEFNEKITDAK